jgi:hypothetical protein
MGGWGGVGNRAWSRWVGRACWGETDRGGELSDTDSLGGVHFDSILQLVGVVPLEPLALHHRLECIADAGVALHL